MVVGVRLRGIWEDLKDSLWLGPTVAVVGAVLLAQAAVALEPLPGWFPEGLVFGGSPEGARAVLSELAGATITVVGVVFSLTIVALQMASSQFTPRLLRTFMRDWRTQLVLSGMLASAVYDVAVLRTVRSDEGDVDAFVPALAVSLGLLIALAAVGLLIFYLHHVTQHMRVDVMMREIRKETIAQLESLPSDRDRLPDQEAPQVTEGALVVRARRDGYLQALDLEGLADEARGVGAVVRLRPALGDWVTRGSTLAWAWPEATVRLEDTVEPEIDLAVADAADRVRKSSGVDRDALATAVHRGLHLGPDRTEAADLAFGIRQLADIAVRALSPGVNDPTTAVQAIDHLTGILMRLAGHPLGTDLVLDDDGQLRAVAPRPTFAAHLALAIDQVRVYGASDPDVLVALAHLLVDLGEAVADSGDRRAAVAVQIDRVAAAVELADEGDRVRVERALEVARETVRNGSRPVALTEAG
jgi:uncharacterized membrane protein